MKQKYGISDAYKNKQKSGTISFVLTQINAARCIGEQDQKNKLEINNQRNQLCFCSFSNMLLLMSKTKCITRFLNIYVANEVKRIFVKNKIRELTIIDNHN